MHILKKNKIKQEQLRQQLYVVMAQHDSAASTLAMIELEINKAQALSRVMAQQNERMAAIQRCLIRVEPVRSEVESVELHPDPIRQPSIQQPTIQQPTIQQPSVQSQSVVQNEAVRNGPVQNGPVQNGPDQSQTMPAKRSSEHGASQSKPKRKAVAAHNNVSTVPTVVAAASVAVATTVTSEQPPAKPVIILESQKETILPIEKEKSDTKDGGGLAKSARPPMTKDTLQNAVRLFMQTGGDVTVTLNSSQLSESELQIVFEYAKLKGVETNLRTAMQTALTTNTFVKVKDATLKSREMGRVK